MQLTFKKRVVELLEMIEQTAGVFGEYLFQKGVVDTLRQLVRWEKCVRLGSEEIKNTIDERFEWYKVNFRESLFHPENKHKFEKLLEVKLFFTFSFISNF